MANKDWPSGLQPLYATGGGSARTERWPLKYKISATPTQMTTAIYKGAMVIWGASGWVKINPLTVLGAATGVLGVAAEYFKGTGSTATELAVWPLKEHIFVIQDDSDTTTNVLENGLGWNFAVLNPTAGSTITGLSTMELDWSSKSTTSGAKAFRTVGLHKTIGEGEGVHMKWLVKPIVGLDYMDNTTNMWA